jgi:hypothetical protein
MVGELWVPSQEFRVRWAAHDVAYYRSGTQPFHHPLVGDVTLDYDALELPADPGQTIVAYTADSRSPARQALDLVASWTSTPDQRRPSPPTTTPDQGAHLWDSKPPLRARAKWWARQGLNL